MTMDLRSGPIMILSLAFSKSPSRPRAIAARGEQRGLVDQVGQIGTGEARRAAGHDVGVRRRPIGTLRMCTFRICSRPRMSGRVT
jgi:hypothetical protein